MPLPARALIILALFAALACCVPAQTPGLKNESDSSVTGKVTIKGKPAAGIVVGMRFAQAENSSPTYKATTNQDGVYRISSIRNGTYVIAPIAPAMISSDDNKLSGQTLVITGGDNAEGIDFDLVRGGVITGKVTDADGHPMIEIGVTLAIVQPSPNQRGSQLPNALTDDRGIYRIFGVHPGRYKVAVFSNRRFANSPSMSVAYYPDVQDFDKAAVVDINQGGEAPNIDIRIAPPAPGFSIAGRVVDESGNPVPNFTIGLSRIVGLDPNRTSNEGTGASAVSDSQGKFLMTNVRPGKYEVSTYGREDSDLQPQGPVSFEVVDSDVTDLVLKTARAAQVSGAVTFEGSKKPASFDATSRPSVFAYVKSDSGAGFSWAGGSGVKPDGSFVINGVKPGILTFEVHGRSRFLLTRIERDGIVQTNGIQIEGTQHVTGVQLFVTYSSGSISGVVKISNGALPSGARIVVQLARIEEPNSGFGGGEVDARGHFLIDGLAAGSYELTVVAYVPNRGRGPTTRQPVSVTDGAVTDVSVILDLAGSPNP